MEDKFSEMLYELNKEYIELVNSKEYKRAINIKRVKDSIIKMNFRYLMETAIKKIFKKKYSDNLTYTNDNFIQQNKANKLNENICKDNEFKIAVYTCIFGDYDEILEPVFQNPNYDYYVITDKEVSKNSVWKKKDISYLNIDNLSNSEKNRFVKLHPHLFLKEYDYSLYIDGNIRIMADIQPLIEDMDKRILGVHRHDVRNCIYTEANVIMLEKRFEKIKNEVNKQIIAYSNEGFPKHQGLYENPILIRKHNDKKCIDIMELWWSQLEQFSKRDQLSLPYVLWKNNIKEDDIYILGNNLRMNPRFRQYHHK